MEVVAIAYFQVISQPESMNKSRELHSGGLDPRCEPDTSQTEVSYTATELACHVIFNIERFLMKLCKINTDVPVK